MLLLYKPMGPTAYQALCALRDEEPAIAAERLAFTGRLDPLAEGLLVVLVGEECREVAAHRGDDKTYALDALFGVSTDSFDSLGLVAETRDVALDEGALRAVLPRWVGEVSQRCAPFSQARVGGRSLISLGHRGITVERPARARRIAAITLDALTPLRLRDVAAEAESRVSLVRGDFRQEAIASRWREAGRVDRALTLARLTVRCSTGTFMRSLAHDLGEALGVPAMAWRILRTRVGAHRVEDARHLRAALS